MSDLLPVLLSMHQLSIQPVARSEAPLSANVRQRSVQLVADLRWLKIEEFLNSTNLSANSRKVYEREMRRFLGFPAIQLKRNAWTLFISGDPMLSLT